MFDCLWVIVALPIASSAVLGVLGRRMSRNTLTALAVGSVGLSAALATWVAGAYLLSPPSGGVYTQRLWSWLGTGSLRVTATLRLDRLSVVMLFVVTLVGFLVHLYSAEYMEAEPDLSRFFAELNLFVGSMLVLVLASDFLLLYLGWEGVGLCSYLLIGFWYRDRANGKAAMKAFIVTRVGDAALLLAIVLIGLNLGTLDISEAMARAVAEWSPAATLAAIAAVLLLIAAAGKSAQAPLQVWLPDAMAGPTPVSALIHAATMVTAGVYLIARTEPLFDLAPGVRLAVAVVGSITLVIGGFSALVQRDMKRVAAYSTMSQLGYMFLALGVGAVSAAIFHLFVHAFFKACIFLGSGAVIHAMEGDHDIFHMGGLKDRMPLTFWTFTVACASLAALPLVTAGFYSKDLILYESLEAPHGAAALWVIGLVGTLLTALYASRLVLLVFFGPLQKEPVVRPGWRMGVPMSVLAVLSVAAGLLEVPRYLGGRALFTGFVGPALPQPRPGLPSAGVLTAVAAAVVLSGISAGWWFYVVDRDRLGRRAGLRWVRVAHAFFVAGWGFDAAYEFAVVRPYRAIAELDRDDILALPYRALGWLAAVGHRVAVSWQTGRLRTYALGMTIGLVIVLLAVAWR